MHRLLTLPALWRPSILGSQARGRRWVGCLALLVLFCCPAFSQSIVVNSPTPSQMLSGTSFTFKCSLSSLPNAASVEWFVNGESQGIVTEAPWELDWNTNYIFNSLTDSVYAVARDALGNTLATSAPVNFSVYNAYMEPSSYMSCGTPTFSTPPTSTWSGTITVSVPIMGTNASNNKNFFAAIDGDWRVQYVQSSSTTDNISINTSMFPNGPHQFFYTVKDWSSTYGATVESGYPVCQGEYTVTLQNGATAMELLVSPKEWVIGPGQTVQLSPIIDHTDNSTPTVPSSPSYSSGNTGVCTVSASGLVAYVGYGTCPITVIASGFSRTIYGYCSNLNIVGGFGQDGQLHNTYTAGQSFWFASMFQLNNVSNFFDPTKTQAQFGVPYKAAGYTAYESGFLNGGGASSLWGNGSFASFQSQVSNWITQLSGPLSTYGLCYHAMTTPLFAGGADSSGMDAFYYGARGPARNYSTPGWTYAAQQWVNSGHLCGISGPDEANNDYHYPLAAGVLGSTNGPSGVTCNASALCTVTWPYGVDYSGPLNFIITGATTNSVLNNTIGGSMYTYTNITATTFQFQAPPGAANITVTPSSDPGLTIQCFAWEWEHNGGTTDYIHYQDFATVFNEIRAASPAPPTTGPTTGSASAISQYGWMGNPSSSDYAEVYGPVDNGAFVHPQMYYVSDLLGNAESQAIRNAWNNMKSARPFLFGNAYGTPLDYGNTGQTMPITGISGPTVTFANPHGINTVYWSISRMTISGSSNSYFNADFFIDGCPTSTTCLISRRYPSATPASTPDFGTITWQDGTTTPNVCMSAGGTAPTGTCSPYNPGGTGTLSCMGTNCSTSINNHTNETFTWSGSGADPYWTSTTFRVRTCPNNMCASQENWREVPPLSQTSASASGLVLANNSYTKGVNLSLTETLMGPRFPGASVCDAAVLGAGGIRLYQANADYTVEFVQGLGFWSDTSNQTWQGGAGPIYDNGEAEGRLTFYSTADCNLLLNRLAPYLFEPRYGAPDIGFNIESSLRKGPSGNLLMAINLQDGAQTRTVDLTSCEVSGQPIIRYSVDWRNIFITTLSPGTSDTPTFQPGQMIAYLCSNNEAAEYMPPTISVRLADVPQATQVAIQYAYTPYMLDNQTGNVFSCGSGTCRLPVDRSIGPVYYRIKYLASNGAVLATSDVQTLR